MEIAENLVMDDPIAVGDEFCVAKHVVVRNDIARVVILACVDRDLHISIDVYFVATDVEFVFAGVDSLVSNVDKGLLLKHYVQFVLGCEHAN